MNSSDTAQLHFDNVRVPQRWRIGEEGMGFTYQMQQFQEERLWAAAGWRKNSEVIQETIAYLRERQAFAKPLLENQYIYFKLAELQTEVEAMARCSTRRGAVRGWQRCDAARLDVQVEVRAPGPRGGRLVRAVLGRMATSRKTRVTAPGAIAAWLDRRRRRRGDDGHHRPRRWASCPEHETPRSGSRRSPQGQHQRNGRAGFRGVRSMARYFAPDGCG